jgi:hypothetical protein
MGLQKIVHHVKEIELMPPAAIALQALLKQEKPIAKNAIGNAFPAKIQPIIVMLVLEIEFLLHAVALLEHSNLRIKVLAVQSVLGNVKAV